jgi:uncharacterized membrane protein HdeD (DUF308 family)
MRENKANVMRNDFAPRLLMTTAIAWLLIGTCAFASDSNEYFSATRFAGLVLLIDSLILVTVAFTCDAGIKEKKWIIAEASASGLFSALLVLDPFFTFLALPFLITPWIVAKGLLTMLAALSLKKIVHGWSGDLTGGMLLIGCGLLINHHPLYSPYGVNILIGIIGWTIGLLYMYDAHRLEKINHILHKGPSGKTAA